ncbi:MAG TPA: hypothetical protein DCW68_01465 [Rhodospirillaceae bacterium]|nr:MAG: hypothetical protein A2018_04430 [Alphaproteobacteria bacterium GWF2_58_20]HAU28766.1 hypothetical protein [Rhodospirillaceae bacterium]
MAGKDIHGSKTPFKAVKEEAEEIKLPHPSFLARLRKHFLTGLLVTTPLGLTLYLTWLVITWIDGLVAAIIPPDWNPMSYLPYQVPGLGLVAVFILLVFIGTVASGYFGKLFVSVGEGILAHMPVVRTIYAATKQVMETVFSNHSSAFRQVVMIEYPHDGMWALAFLTGKTTGEVQAITTDEVINVFLPTTPNPTSGFLLFVPRKKIIPLSMTVEEGIKMIMSAGIITPPQVRDMHPNLKVGQPEAK